MPKYYVNERKKILHDRELILGKILSKMGPSDSDKVRALILLVIVCYCYATWFSSQSNKVFFPDLLKIVFDYSHTANVVMCLSDMVIVFM